MLDYGELSRGFHLSLIETLDSKKIWYDCAAGTQANYSKPQIGWNYL